MSEWKRVFCDRQRIVIVLLITVFCLALFLTSVLGTIQPNILKDTLEANKYVKYLYSEWEALDTLELIEAVKAEQSCLSNYYYYVQDFDFIEPVFNNDDEAATSVSHIPYYISQSEDAEELTRTFDIFFSRLSVIRSQIEHINGYNDYLSKVQEQAKTQSQVSIFNQSGSFSSKNLQKTAEDFERLDGVNVTFGNNLGIESWLKFNLADYFFLAIMVVVVLSFLEERKKGLWSVVRCTRNGRARLGLERIGVLLSASSLAAVLIYGIPLIISLATNSGFDGLDRSLQSLESFKTCTLRITISQWLVQYFAVKVASGLLLGLLLWCILGSLANVQFSLSVLGVTLVGEYILFEYLPVQSFLNVFKYFNIFSFVHTSRLYTNYLNINLFGNAIGIRSLMLTVLPIAIAFFALWAMLIQTKRYPEGNKDILSKISHLVNKIIDLFRTRLSLGGWEVYKVLVFQFGIFIIAGILIVTNSLSYSVYIEERDYWYQAYLEDAEGPIDNSFEEYLARAKENINSSMNEFELTSALDRIEREIKEIKERAEEGGYAPWLVDYKTYASVYGNESCDRQRLNAAIAICLLAFSCAGIAAFERQSGVEKMVRSTKRGRSSLFAGKTIVASLMAVTVWCAVYLREFFAFVADNGIETLSAPVKNIAMLSQFPLEISFAGYLAMLYAIRLIMLILTSFIALLISHYCLRITTSYIVNLAVLGLPALLVILGADVLKYISPLIPVSSAEIMWSLTEDSLMPIVAWVIMVIFSVLALIAARRKWLGSK